MSSSIDTIVNILKSKIANDLCENSFILKDAEYASMHVPFLSDKGACTTLVVYVDKKEEESHFCMSANSGRIYISDSDLAPPISIDIHHGETRDDIFEKILELNLSDDLGITNDHIEKMMLTYNSIAEKVDQIEIKVTDSKFSCSEASI